MKHVKPGFLALLLAGSVILAAMAPVSVQAQQNDSAIQASIATAIQNDSVLQGQHITASVDKGVVTLTGTVQTNAQLQQAATDAANVAGVSGILNQLKVTNPGTSANSAGLAAQASADQLGSQNQTQNEPQVVGQEQPQGEGSTQESAPPPPPDANQTGGQYQQAPPPVYGQQRPEYQQGYGYPQQQPQVPYYQTPSGPITIPAGTLLRVRLSEPLNTTHVKDGAYFQVTSAIDVYERGVLAIPRGAVLTGQVVDVKKAGELKGSDVLQLHLTSINLGGRVFPIATDVWSSKGPNKAGYTAGNTAGGAVLGAIIGGIIGRGAGAAIGAGVGAAGGLAASSATRGPRIYLPAEAMVDFHLTNPVTVQPVSWEEAQRLASSAPQPVLMRRPRPVYVTPGPYYGPYPYGYPYGYPYPY
jgi:BON domain